jgi:serine/threonine protein kinase/Flp pilus assembly protein TadD
MSHSEQHDADSLAAPNVGFMEARSIKRELLSEFRAEASRGESVRPEDVLPRWPTDAKDDLDFASLLFEDYHQRRRRGEKPSVDEYSQRFPEHQQSLSQLVSRHEFLMSFSDGDGSDSKGPLLGLPGIGDEVFGFRLRGELGRGAFARVFMAEQASLAGRPVVLKVSGIDGDEPYTLAQLQHTNVVPIYSVHEDGRAGLRAVCMPYFGGASLSSVLKPLWAEGRLPTLGQQLVDTLRSVQAPSLETLQKPDGEKNDGVAKVPIRRTAGQTPLDLLSGLSYVSAAAWIVARLAEGLQHAHQRGVLHRDIKPSNILLGGDGQPMLLDFNLAQNQQAQGAKGEATLGGTVAYMAPEHLRALANPSAASARQVDERSDVYSMGMVLYEMLTGHSPFDQSASYSIVPVMIEAMAVERSQTTPSVRRLQPSIPWSMESIVRKCMAPNPADRYQHAEELAEDLRRFLDDRPLLHAPELSRAERVRKWIRRHPRLTSSSSVATVAALLLVGAGAALAGVYNHLATAREELEGVADRDRKLAYEAGAEQALCLINTIADTQDHLRQGLSVCEETLGLYGVLDQPDWQDTPAWRRLSDEDRLQLAETTRELLLLLAGARVRTTPDNSRLREALGLLDRADAIAGLAPSKAVWSERAAFFKKLGEREQADEARHKANRIAPTSARDHYLLAITYTRQENLAGAIAELDQALRLNARHYWSLVQRGICHQELGDPLLAASDFSTCIGLRPELHWGYFNKGYVLDQSGRKVEAIDAYSEALRRAPGFIPALKNRGLAYLALGKHDLALTDFDRALELGQDDPFLHTDRGVALESLGRHAEADESFQKAFMKSQRNPEVERDRIRWVYAFAVSGRLPEKAEEMFGQTLHQEPTHKEALYGLAMLAVRQNRPERAVQLLDRAIEAHPFFMDARRHRAVLLARLSCFAAAQKEINWCLERERQEGATLYAAACVTALAAEKGFDAAAANQALAWLEKAFQAGYGQDKAAHDPDLAGIRELPRFQEIVRAAKRAKSVASPSSLAE